MKVKNSAIKRLTVRYLRVNQKRNLVLLIAIALTAFMITAVLSTAIGMTEELQLQQIRFVGSIAHAEFSYPTTTQLERLSQLDYVEDYGIRQRLAQVENQMGSPPLMGLVSMEHWNESSFSMHLPAWINVVGNYPTGENEIMTSRWVLEQLGIENPEIGMVLPLTFVPIDGHTLQERSMVLTGFYTSLHELMTNSGHVLVSDVFLEQISMMHLEHQTVDILFASTNEVLEDANRLTRNLGIDFEQDFHIESSFIMDSNQEVITMMSVALFILFLMFTGFLLIYSVFHSSIVKDIRFYGRLKTLGATKKQIRQLLVRQLIGLSFIGIPIGLLFGLLVSFILIPLMIGDIEQNMIISFSPIVYGGAILFTFATVLMSVAAPAKKLMRLSAIESIKYSGEIKVRANSQKKVSGKLYKLALRNIFRDRKRAMIVILSLFLGLSIFMATTMITSSLDLDAYLEFHAENLFGHGDFSIQHEQVRYITRPLNDGLVEQIATLERVERVQTISLQRLVSVTYEPAFSRHLDACKEWRYELMGDPFCHPFEGEDGGRFLETEMFAIEGEELQLLDDSFDVEAFERGEFIVMATDFPEDFIDTEVIEGQFWGVGSGGSSEIVENFSIPLGGTIPWRSFRWEWGMEEAPRMLVSHAFLNSFKDDPLIIEILIDAYAGEELALYDELTHLIMNREHAQMSSRIELTRELETGRRIMFILGGSIATVLGLMGILNFVNALSISIITRKLEFATLESIGMTQKQIKKMLIYEGLWYAILTLLFVFSLGSAISFGFYDLWVNLPYMGDYMIFTYPWLPMIIVTVTVVFICMIIPVIFYHTQSKQSIVEKLREDG